MRFRATPLLVALLAAAAGLVACADIQGTIPARKPLAAGACASFTAGAARADLTPPPGFPLGGFSIASQMSRGAWTPLQARAIYLRDTGCQAVVLVSTDLMIMPNGLADRVADLLAGDATTRHIGRENMLLTATENHLSPGNYFSSRLYNAFSSHVAGFDPDLFEFLAQRIARAVRQAVAAQQPAILRSGHATAPDLFRNRALPAFLRNREAVDFLVRAEADGGAPCPPLPYQAHPLASPERFHELSCLAVTPRLDVIEAVSPDGERIALAGFLATHTTVLPAPVEVYGADLLGLTSLRMERGELTACAADGDFPVVALFNGAQGDVTTRWSTRDRADVLALSDRIGEALCAALPGSAEPAPGLAFQYREVEPLSERSFDDPFDGQKYAHQTPAEPEAGAPELGGAADGRTIFYELAQREEVTSFRRTQHGSKIAPFTYDSGLMRIAAGRWGFRMDPPPKKAPLTVLRVGGTTLLGVPGEMTTMMGDRTRRLVAKQAGLDVERVVVVGFGNGHVSYFPTTEEYDAQWYEGASDFYGPGTGSYLALQLLELTAGLSGTSTLLPERDYAYRTGVHAAFRPRDVGHPAYHVDDGLTGLAQVIDLEPETAGDDPDNPIVADTGELRVPKRDHPTWCFLDALPLLAGLTDAASAPGCHRNLPEVAIHEKGSNTVAVVDGRRQDSGGAEIVTVLAAAGEQAGEWCAIWLAPHELDDDGVPTNLATEYEFRVRGITALATDPPRRSPPFTLKAGFDQADPQTLVCDGSQDVDAVGGIFTERALCTPLERPAYSAVFSAFADAGVSYCEAPAATTGGP